MNYKYRKGANFEREIKTKLELEGWFVVCSAGSRTLPDLVALRKHSPPILIQCKNSRIIQESEVKRLRDLARTFGGVPILASKDQGRVLFKNFNFDEALKPHLDQQELFWRFNDEFIE